MARLSVANQEREDLIKRLKEEVLNLREKLGSRKELTTGLDQLGLGIVLNENREYCLVELKYSPNAANATLDKVTILSKNYDVAIFKIQKILVEKIMMPLLKKRG